MYYVYIIRSLKFSNQTYIGFTEDLKKRLFSHNDGKNFHTNKYKPWKVIYYCAFVSKAKAMDFERYLKTSSGKAFSNKRLI